MINLFYFLCGLSIIPLYKICMAMIKDADHVKQQYEKGKKINQLDFHQDIRTHPLPKGA